MRGDSHDEPASDIGRLAAQGIEPSSVALGWTRTTLSRRLAKFFVLTWGFGRSEILVEAERGTRRAATLGGAGHPQHREPSAGRGCDHIASMNEAACFEGSEAVDAELAVDDQPNGRRARLHHPRAPQPFVEPLPDHAVSYAPACAPRGSA